MSDLTSLVTEVAVRVEVPAFEEITHRARSRRVRRVGTTVAAVGLAAVMSVVALTRRRSLSGRAGNAATHIGRATARPAEQMVNGRNATAGRSWIAPERPDGLTVRAWAQCADDTLTVTQCDPARSTGRLGGGRCGGTPNGRPSGYDEGRLAYAGDGVWVLRPTSTTTPSLSPAVAASTRLGAPVTLASIRPGRRDGGVQRDDPTSPARTSRGTTAWSISPKGPWCRLPTCHQGTGPSRTLPGGGES